jgi:signal transduction histidine kinase/CheY-like chemotaxis protein
VRDRVAHLPLKVKLVAVTAALVAGLTAALLIELPRAMDQQAQGWLVSRSLGMGRLLAHSLEAAVDFDDSSAADEALAGIRTGRGIAYAVLRRSDGLVLSAWGTDGARIAEPPGAAERVETSGGLLRVRIPILTRSGKAASLLMGFGLNELEERRRETRQTVLAIAVVFMLAGLVASVLIAQVLTRPLLQLTEVARRVAAGQEPAIPDLPLDQRDETGVLAAAFRQMLGRLSVQQDQIRAINADLARRVQERTQELARTNEALAELERTQQQLVMADRRISIGRLAAGVAHEINNPLTFVAGNLDYMADQLPELARSLEDGDPRAAQSALARFAEAVAETRQGSQRVAAIVRGLRTFARDDLDKREPLRLDSPLEAAIEMAMHEIKHRARLVRRFESVPRVLGNEVRLSQVFLNLLVNAAHAIAEGASDRNEIRVSVHPAGVGQVAVEVSDTGCGIPQEEQRRIFDPFFTTKPVGVGTGLGLSISRNIVEKLGGEISFQSTVGKGTTFRVLLPVARAEELARPEEEAAARPAALPRSLRLLVVDDEPMVASSVVRTMQGEIQVVVATGGREALERIAGGERFDRVLCDVMMPDLSGPDLLAEVERRAPGLAGAFIFMTGGAFTEGASAFLERHRGPFLEKPLNFDELRRLLHAGLG